MDSEPTINALRVPRWAAPVLFGIAVALIPWTLYLTWTLPAQHTTEHWQIAWGGFDIFLAAALSATAVGLRRGAARVEAFAGVASALLLVDAWFDVVLAEPGASGSRRWRWRRSGELPLALFCLWIALNAERAIHAAGGRTS